ncbi:MAG TPA: hypothetical protein VKG21_22705 [Casimicrobiaceae bacterium]|nr:hypothetical protein [Casimicrobiaceae bacterium]
MSKSRRPSRTNASARVGQPSLFEFLILSMLLHLLVIVLFGNPSGGTRRSEQSSSSLEVILGRPTTETGTGFRLAPGAETTTPGSALLPRAGAAPEAPAAPFGADERPAGQPPPQPAPERTERPAPTPESAAPTKETAPPAPSRPRELPPGLNLRAPQEVDRKFAPRPPLEELAPPKFEGRLAPPAELAPLEVPAAPTTPLERIAPSKVERELARPLDLAPREIPATPAAPIERIVAPQLAPEIAAPAELKAREQPSAAAPIENIAPAKIERQLAPPVELAPSATPIAPAAPLERIAPPASERELAAPTEIAPATVAPATPIERLAPPSAAPADRIAPPAELRAPSRVEGEALPAERAPKPEGAGPPATTPTPRGERAPPAGGAPPAVAPEKAPAAPERFHFGSPTPEEEIFKPRGNVMPPLDEVSSPPYIDLEGARRAAAHEVLREGPGSRGVLALPVPPPPEYKSKEARAIEKAVKPDCRTEYAALGLLAVPALLMSALADTGCRW